MKLISAVLCGLLISVLATQSGKTRCSTVYDYVIAGGGTSGLLLAVALSADPNVTVAVLEAGPDARDDVRITVPENEGQILGTELDWQRKSVPQTHVANNQTFTLSSGKTLGGSSAMNFMLWQRASKVEFDAWGTVLNNTGWSWDVLLDAFKASESFTPPVNDSDVLTYEPLFHGTSGPIAGSLERRAFSLYSDYVVPSLQNLGVPKQEDPDGGVTTGARFVPLAINASSYTRSYSATAYSAVEARSNLHVLINTTVARVLWDNSPSKRGVGVHAIGLETFPTGSQGNGPSKAVYGSSIVLSAGTLGSPQLLELSGVGDATLLTSLGIETKVDLPAVGTQLQDHLVYSGGFGFNISNFTGGEFVHAFQDFATPSRILSEDDYEMASQLLSTGTPPDGISTAAWDMLRHLWARDEPVIEFGWFYNFVSASLLHPLSQGSVHITANDPQVFPASDLNFNGALVNGTSWDLWLLSKAVQYYATALPKSSPLASIAASFSLNATLPFDQFQAQVFQGLGLGNHLTGTCALLPREQGGVVDSNFLVYGTQNLFVVDASVIPVSPGQHTMGLVWALAMHAAKVFASAHA